MQSLAISMIIILTVLAKSVVSAWQGLFVKMYCKLFNFETVESVIYF